MSRMRVAVRMTPTSNKGWKYGCRGLLRPCCSPAAAFVSGQDIFYKTKVESFASFARCFVGIYKNRHGAWCDDGHVLLERRPIRIAVHTHTHNTAVQLLIPPDESIWCRSCAYSRKRNTDALCMSAQCPGGLCRRKNNDVIHLQLQRRCSGQA